MTGSGTQNIDNFTSQTMDRHQMIMNTEVMKHISIMNRASVREIMLQHERTFKEQVHDLHKLYEVQRSLMHKAKHREADFYPGILQASIDHDQARGKFWEGMSSAGVDKASETHQHQDFANSRREEKPKNATSTGRKKVIDLEQLPEDDTDDEMEGTEDESGPTVTKPIPSEYLKGFGAGMSSNHGNAMQLLTSGSLYFDCKEGSKHPLPVVEQTSVMSTQNCNLSNISEKPNALYSSQTDCTAVKSSQNATNWVFQGNSCNTDPVSSAERLIQQQAKSSSDFLMQEALLKVYHQQSQGYPVARHSGSKALSSEDSCKTTLERSSTVFTVEGYAQGGKYANVVCSKGLEIKPSEGRHAVSNFTSPSATVLANKGQSNEQDTNLWYAQNPVVQNSEYQQKVAYCTQSLQSSIIQSTWPQSSQNTHGNLYAQQMVYGIQVPDSSQIGFRMEGLQINQGDISGASKYPNLSPKPPFKKPSKLVLKNNGSTMDLRVVSPEREATRKTTEQHLDNSKSDLQNQKLKVKDVKSEVKWETNEVSITHERGQRDSKLPCGTTVHDSEKLSVSIVEALDAETSNLPTDSSDGIKDCKPASHGLAMASTNQPDTFPDVNTQRCMGDERNVYTSSSSVNRSEIQCNAHATDNSIRQDNLNIVESDIHQLEENKATNERETSSQTAAKINEDKNALSLSGEGSSLIPGKDDVEGSVTGCNNNPRYQSNNEHVQISRRSEDGKSPYNSTSTHNGQSSSPDTASPISLVEEDSNDAEDAYNRNLFKGLVVPKGNHFIPSTSDRSSRKHDAHGKRSLPNNALGQPSDIGTTSSQVTMQAVSMQSTSTEPGVVKQEKECSSKELEKNVVDKRHGKGPSSVLRKRTSIAAVSEGPSTSLPSSVVYDKQTKPENLDFDIDEQISDTENFAAAILLSFAPRTSIQNTKKHVKGDIEKMSSNIRKQRPAENFSSSTRQRGASPVDCARDTESEDAETANCLQSGSKTHTRRIDNVDSVRYPTKDRYREENANSRLIADSRAKGSVKSTRSKVLRVVSMCNSVDDNPIDCSKSKQLDRIGAGYMSIKSTDTRDHPIPYKIKDIFHTPTGRRSSRGPPMAGRVHHESVARLQQQTHHYSDAGVNADINSRKRDESSGIPGKLENGIKNKPWNDINKKRNRIRGQINDIAYKKVQR